ncbi:MAG: 4Fe-4S cluster-binding domain-containing protein [Candidatus Peribacteria bacterium]|nr:MAG: 4Fe-4S cluster-binding domain-containing protein [Candidatus Peribacteria bacterium]
MDTFSLIDYPSKSCCIVFTLGCNLRCKFCYNSEFVLPEKVNVTKKNLISLSAFFNFLDSRV